MEDKNSDIDDYSGDDRDATILDLTVICDNRMPVTKKMTRLKIAI